MELVGYLSVLPYYLYQLDEESPAVACSLAARELGVFFFDCPAEPAFYILRTDLGSTPGSALLEPSYYLPDLRIRRYRVDYGTWVDVNGDGLPWRGYMPIKCLSILGLFF